MRFEFGRNSPRFQDQKPPLSVLGFAFLKDWLSLKLGLILVYIAFFLGGIFGIHNLLLARYGMALFQFALATIGLVTFPLGFVLLVIVGLTVLVDLFAILGLVHWHYRHFSKHYEHSQASSSNPSSSRIYHQD